MSDYCETPEFYREHLVTAAKQHCCCECRNVIHRGSAGVFEVKNQPIDCRLFSVAKLNSVE